jgi:hypothetical protein
MNLVKSLLWALFTVTALFVPTGAVHAQPAFTVHVDTLVVKGNEVVCGDYTFSCYKGDWHWTRNCPYPTLLFEDDLYTVSRDIEDVLFTEKQPSLYVDSYNGWPQYEQVNRQYYFTGKFHQILRHGDYYYFINPKQVDSLRIDQSPGNPLVKNRLPGIEGVYRQISEWCDPISGYGDDWFAHWVYCIEGCCIGNVRYYVYTPSVDTLYHGAFIADDQLFYLIQHDNQTVIAQQTGKLLTRVVNLGQGWNFYDIYEGQSRWWNLGPDDSRLILPFSSAEGSAGLLTIDVTDIHIRYIVQNKTVVP